MPTLLVIFNLIFGPTFNPKCVMNMDNYGKLVKKPYLSHTSHALIGENRCAF
jgi:hypothetical protein